MASTSVLQTTALLDDDDGRPSDPRDPEVRLCQLLDRETCRPLSAPDRSGVLAARGRIEGAEVIAYCTDATLIGGSMGSAGCMRIVQSIELAVQERIPVIGLWHSGGARLAEGVEALDAVGHVFAAMVRASGKVPQISVVLGPAAGGAAYGPALTDVVIMSRTGRIFVTGPDVVCSVTGEQVDMESLGGPLAHGRKSGVVHIVADDESDAYYRARELAAMFTRPGTFDQHRLGEGEDLRALLPETARRAYDVRPLVRRILDHDHESTFAELQRDWAPNVVVGLGRLGGRTVGVIANNPLRMGGCLDSVSAEKSARFVRMCDSFGVPLVVLVDVPGYLPGTSQEWGGVVRRGAKLLHAFAEAIVPRVTLVTRKAYGGAYIAMNSQSLGATAVLAWQDAEVSVMGAEAAVGILHRKTLAAAVPEHRDELRARLTDEHAGVAGGINRALSVGVIDEVVQPDQTRRRLFEVLATAPAARGMHGNIPL